MILSMNRPTNFPYVISLTGRVLACYHPCIDGDGEQYVACSLIESRGRWKRGSLSATESAPELGTERCGRAAQNVSRLALVTERTEVAAPTMRATNEGGTTKTLTSFVLPGRKAFLFVRRNDPEDARP